MTDLKNDSFAKRLATVRKSQGLSQRDLAKLVGISHRMIAYYEAQTTRPPAGKLADIARVLKVTTDQLLGATSISLHEPQNSRLWKRLRIIDKLPRNAQKKVLELAELLAKSPAH